MNQARLLHTSSVVTVGASHGRPLTEDDTWNLRGLQVEYMQAKRTAEELALAAAARDRDVVVVHPGLLIGPDDHEGSFMIAKLFMAICRLSPHLRKLIWRHWYQFLARSYKREEWSFINYGYASLDPQTEKLQLDDADEPDRYCIQLYHHVANVVDLKDLKVLEVGSGRGGGAYYIKCFLRPKRVVGVDFSKRAVAFCKKRYSFVEGLSFVVGDAECLPFRDDSFDAVVNVESSHCYGSINAFLMQVKRVLRQGGYFLYADFRDKDEIDNLRRELRHSGMTLIKETNITTNVIEALNLDNERKLTLIQKAVHKMLLGPFQEFAGVRGSMMYEGFRTGEVIYSSFVLQKPNHQ